MNADQLVDLMMEFLKRWGLPGHERAIAKDLVELCGYAAELGADAAAIGFDEGVKKALAESRETHE